MRKIIISLILLTSLLVQAVPAKADVSEDALLHERYELYLKYQKKKKYGKYKDYLEVKEKYGFDDAAKRMEYKEGYDKYRQYKKNPKRFYYYAKFIDQYKAYGKYKEVKEYSRYKNYKKYNNKKYDKGKNYGSAGYAAGHARYEAFTRDIQNVTANPGPEIRVGLWNVDSADIKTRGNALVFSANKPFAISDCTNAAITTIPTGETARVTYIDASQGDLNVYNPNGLLADTNLGSSICFQAADGNNADMIFATNKPNTDYIHFRGKMKVQYSDTANNGEETGDNTRIWITNSLPLEQYMWGYGEIGGGVDEHSKAMTVTARTYAKWYLENATKWNDEGFTILSTSSSQIYYGYDYEIAHPSVSAMARKTNGIVMRRAGGAILAAYSSWTDGATRKYENGNWGRTYAQPTPGNLSTVYPELSAVADPYGKHPYLTGVQLAEGCTACINDTNGDGKKENYNGGNHMVGLSANGSLVLARDFGWQWSRILSYYYSGIDIVKEY